MAAVQSVVKDLLTSVEELVEVSMSKSEAEDRPEIQDEEEEEELSSFGLAAFTAKMKKTEVKEERLAKALQVKEHFEIRLGTASN